MNYRHCYHAGNFADVVKHSVLGLLVEHLLKKPAPFCFIDTHAGAGAYDLQSEAALKTREAEAGVLRLLAHKPLPAVFTPYLQALAVVQEDSDTLRAYPGSPMIVNALRREQDTLILNELHPEEFEVLRHQFKPRSGVMLHQRDAYEFLPAVLPPKCGRGLILIDPPFEKADELQQVETVLEKALQRFRHGIYVIWLPLTDKQPHFFMSARLKQILAEVPSLQLSFYAHEEEYKGLIGTTMIIVNPPYRFAQQLEVLLPFLEEILADEDEGYWQIRELVGGQ